MRARAGCLLLLCLVAACAAPDQNATDGRFEGRPARPYTLDLTLQPPAPAPGENARLIFKLTHSDSGKPVQDLQVLHERVIHNFIVSRDFRHFAHIHHEDFRPLTSDVLKDARLSFPYAFPQAGAWRIVSEFTHRDRSWIKHFDLHIGESARPPQVTPDLSRSRQFGDYQARLSVSPDPPVAGHPVEMVLELERPGGPVTDLGMHLGAELHAATWRIDGQHFGHMHSYTPHMAAMMRAARDNPAADARRARANMMLEMAAGSREQVYFGPRLPMRHVFDAPGTYALFIQCAPGGEPRVFDFMLEVKPFEAGMDLAVESMVEPEAGH